MILCLLTQFAVITKRTDRVIGVHFFNLANVMKLIEVILLVQTSDETLKQRNVRTFASHGNLVKNTI